MCDFKPGDELVAIDNSDYLGLLPKLAVGAIYVCSAIDTNCGECCECGSCLGVQVEGIDCTKVSYCPCSFRKAQRRDLSAWLESAATDTDHLDKPIKTPARPKVDALLKRVQSGAFG